MPRQLKKSKYKSVVIKKKRYYFYKITWVDITGDSSHADLHTALGMMPSVMITHAYLLDKDRSVKYKLFDMKNLSEILKHEVGEVTGEPFFDDTKPEDDEQGHKH